MEKKLQNLIDVISIIKDIIEGDFSLTVTNKSECIYSEDGNTVKAPFKVGPLNSIEMTGIQQIIKEKKKLYKILKKEIDGLDMKIIAVPIFGDDGEVIGTLGISQSTEKIEEIKNNSMSLMSSLQKVSETIKGIADDALKLSEQLNFMIEKIKQVEENISESNQFVDLIHNISKQSNLLGLNASIEAARAGENGRGFSVVANEMRKLAQLSQKTAEKMSVALLDIDKGSKFISNSISTIGEIAGEQASSVEEIAATIEQIAISSKVLVDNLNINI